MKFEFEYDPNKSASNKSKHKIDFEEAQKLWDDPRLVRVPAKSETEDRFLFIGRIGRKYWAAITTYRNEAIRIISVRRARDKEIEFYGNE